MDAEEEVRGGWYWGFEIRGKGERKKFDWMNRERGIVVF